jgi:hypothetical protein
MTARKPATRKPATRKPATSTPAKPDLHLPTWNVCPDCGNRSTGRIQHGPHEQAKP